MIKWNCNFNIDESTVQLDVALIRLLSNKIINDQTEIEILITDQTGNIVVKQIKQLIDTPINNVDAIYKYLLTQYLNSTIIPENE